MADHAQAKPCENCGTLTTLSGNRGDADLYGRCPACGRGHGLPNPIYVAPPPTISDDELEARMTAIVDAKLDARIEAIVEAKLAAILKPSTVPVQPPPVVPNAPPAG